MFLFARSLLVLARFISTPRLVKTIPTALLLLHFDSAGQSIADEAAGASRHEPFLHSATSFLQSHCFDCHGDGATEGGMDLERLLSQPRDRAARDTWHKVMQHLRVGTMPPADHDARPEPSATRQFVQQIDREFFRVDCDEVRDPGRVTIRRLNREEYQNTVEDLLEVTFDARETLPRDDVGNGFDNIGDVLSVSPLLLEKYLAAAETIAEDVIYTGPRAALRSTRVLPAEIDGEPAAGLTIENDYLLINREGAAFAEFSPYVAGNYELRIRAFGVQSGDELTRMAVEVAGERIAEFEVQGHREPDDYRVPLEFGPKGHPLGHQLIRFVYLNDFNQGGDKDRDLAIVHVDLEGPAHLEGDAFPLPPSHLRVISTQPKEHQSVAKAARINLKRLARRAFRRPVTGEDVAAYVQLVKAACDRGESFEHGMRIALQAILVSPRFLFRVETPLHPDDPEHVDAVGQYELASRLSYFLWSTMPDRKLFRLARKGMLTQPEVLSEQVERMLDDPRATNFVENFAGQWLNLRSLADVRPNRQRFPDFNEKLAADMHQETLLLVTHLLQENKSLGDLLSADYTFLNERLANHYGIEGVTGDEFRMVSLAELPRRGVLTQASILTLTSDPARTLPVKRGKWILENVLGTPPPPPPPNVPPLESDKHSDPNATLRERLALHRQDAACAGCHREMDPLGLAFENYDAIGRWRDNDADRPIDTAGTLADGRRFQNAIELIELLQERENEYAEQVTRAMLTYALGRGLEPYDHCAVDEILTALKRDDYRMRTLVREIVMSLPFQMRRGDGGRP